MSPLVCMILSSEQREFELELQEHQIKRNLSVSEELRFLERMHKWLR